jgi:hypothetical protein
MCTDAIRRVLGAQIGVVQAMATEATVRNALAAAAAAAVLAANGSALQQQHHHYLTLELSSTIIRRRNIMSLLLSYIDTSSSACRHMTCAHPQHYSSKCGRLTSDKVQHRR